MTLDEALKNLTNEEIEQLKEFILTLLESE
jgi:hypothetical protein